MSGKFLRLKCMKCNNEQIVYDKPSSIIKCLVCDSLIANPSGGKANIQTKVMGVLK